MKARVSPIISADAVAVVRRGLRSEFWPASCPIGPNSFASAAPVARRNGRPITGLAAVTPSSTASTPAPTHHPLCGTALTNRPITASGMPSAISAIPSSRRRRTDDSGRATSSRSAWTGAIRPVRRAGSQAATIVTMIPVAYAATGVRGARMSGWSARSRPNVATRERIPIASTYPRPSPSVEPTTPTTNASSWTERITCRLDAPSARSSASSRLRWATRIEKVLTMM